ncbi:MAG: transporter substrate-binding domain-containing protein [Chloroflexales bacterium]|nr:transporter substrate-binding domain-containing protein [Chloroflexales bacterium]
MDRPWQTMPGRLLAVLLLATLLVACGQSGGAAPSPNETADGSPASTTDAPPTPATDAPTTEPAGDASDLLVEVTNRGTLLIATDANYKPQSFKNPDGSWEGFDIDVAREIANRLGVEAEFLDISFDVVTAGSWNDRWDINVGSMTVTEERKEALLFTTPYYYTPASFVVHQDSSAASIDDLAGKKVGVGAATTYLDYLNGTLVLAGEEIRTAAPQTEVQVYDADLLAIADLALGDGARLDAVLIALPTAENAISEEQPLKILGAPVYYEALGVVLDKSSTLNSQSLTAEISRIIEEMRSDGILAELSMKYYGVDITSKQ